MKAPAFQFYTGDWLKDPNLSMCSPATRGVWMDLLCAMHELGRCGQVTGAVEQLCRLCRCTPAEMSAALTELSTTNTASVSERNGSVTVVCRRMQREAEEKPKQRPSIPLSIRRVVKSIGYCAYCGRTESLTIDHIIPYSKGGMHSIDNLQCLCWACNRAKSDMPEEEYFARLDGE